MRRLFMVLTCAFFTSLTCVALSLGTAATGPASASAAAIPGPFRGGPGAHFAIPRPFPGGPGAHSAIPRPVSEGPGAHSAAWRSGKGISRVLLLTVARGETATPSDRVVLLQCTSPGGTHPRATEACRLLEPVSGDLADLKASRDVACTKRYEPVTVSGSGMWDGQHMWFERTFGNPCEVKAYTGAVFNF